MIWAQWSDLAKVFITAILVPGGPLVTWLTLRHKKRSEDVSKGRVAEAELTHVLSDTGIAARWQAYADAIEKRLNHRIDEQDRQIRKTEENNDRLLGLLDVYGIYSRTLRLWIEERRPPPPPAYPPAIDPACTGWEFGDHVTNHHPQEDS